MKMDYTVALNEERHALQLIDQTKLPTETCILYLSELAEIREAIYRLKVRGAPAIGVAAAIGIYLAADRFRESDYAEFYRQFKKDKEYLNASRPTAVNLSWALARMEGIVICNAEKSVADIKEALHMEAKKIWKEDIEVCKKIGEYGLELLKPGDGILTHCNAGSLATVTYGTATAPMYLGHEQGYAFRIFADETRPLLQGARLTAYELQEAGMDVTLICDNMSGSVMRNGWVNAVLVGCDRVAANGDTANKIGTAMVALAAKRYGIPFYVCAPSSTIDFTTATGKEIVIEQRSPEEVTNMWYEKPMAPEGVKVYNPCFDITDADLISGIITEYGTIVPPFQENLKKLQE
ncbi:MAG: S-methyl-5-thioribose-1-phosphate isomerase [Lachnospiraceae bacterium]